MTPFFIQYPLLSKNRRKKSSFPMNEIVQHAQRLNSFGFIFVTKLLLSTGKLRVDTYYTYLLTIWHGMVWNKIVRTLRPTPTTSLAKASLKFISFYLVSAIASKIKVAWKFVIILLGVRWDKTDLLTIVFTLIPTTIYHISQNSYQKTYEYSLKFQQHQRKVLFIPSKYTTQPAVIKYFKRFK